MQDFMIEGPELILVHSLIFTAGIIENFKYIHVSCVAIIIIRVGGAVMRHNYLSGYNFIMRPL